MEKHEISLNASPSNNNNNYLDDCSIEINGLLKTLEKNLTIINTQTNKATWLGIYQAQLNAVINEYNQIKSSLEPADDVTLCTRIHYCSTKIRNWHSIVSRVEPPTSPLPIPRPRSPETTINNLLLSDQPKNQLNNELELSVDEEPGEFWLVQHDFNEKNQENSNL